MHPMKSFCLNGYDSILLSKFPSYYAQGIIHYYVSGKAN